MATNITEWFGRVRGDIPGCPVPVIKRAIIDTCRDFCGYTKMWKEKLAPISAVALSSSDIQFVPGSPDTITTDSEDFTEDFTNGDIIVTSSKENPGEHTISTVAETTLTLSSNNELTDEDTGGFTLAIASYSLSSSNGDIVDIASAAYLGETMVSASESQLDIDDPTWRMKVETYPARYLMGQDRKIRIVGMPYDSENNALEVYVFLKPSLTATSVEDFLYNDYLECIADGTIARCLKMRNQPWTDMESAGGFMAMYENVRNGAFHKGRKGFVSRFSERISG